ncbi:MAG: hypothetical protein ACR2QM_13445 [Longimicrobiales bacterium]
MRILKNLLWLDCGAAALVGAGVILFAGPLSGFEGLPRSLLIFTGVVNLVYGSYSCSLAVRADRTEGLIKLLVLANLAWVPVCFGLAVAFSESATPFGFMHLIGEGLFVGGLAALEWRNRELLLTAA